MSSRLVSLGVVYSVGRVYRVDQLCLAAILRSLAAAKEVN